MGVKQGSALSQQLLKCLRSMVSGQSPPVAWRLAVPRRADAAVGGKGDKWQILKCRVNLIL